jgi:hypothetical protein
MHDIDDLIDSFGQDLSNKDLRGMDFSNRILVAANFNHSDCTGCNFSNCDLSFAIFKEANLYRANFTGAKLYVTKFEDCDLTRAIFKKSFPYGIKFVGHVNVTYANFMDFEIEKMRRIHGFYMHDDNFKEINFGSKFDEHNPIITNFKVNKIKITFREFKPFEIAMQKSQIYSRLKRVFAENNFMEEAGIYHYWERYWLTRSFYRHLPLENLKITSYKHRIIRTFYSYLSEIISGYGERPLNTIITLFIWIFLFSLLYILLSLVSSESFVMMNNKIISFIQEGKFNFNGLINSIYYSFSVLTFKYSNVHIVGYAKILTIIESLGGILILAILIASLVRTTIRD